MSKYVKKCNEISWKVIICQDMPWYMSWNVKSVLIVSIRKCSAKSETTKINKWVVPTSVYPAALGSARKKDLYAASMCVCVVILGS